MKRKNTTRNALFTSIISLLLCVSMLVGTTFAWFTDSVESGINQIAAGNLDVELYHTNKYITSAEEVDGLTDLFTVEEGKSVLWEPGVVVWENLTVANVGTLALKYQLGINFDNATPAKNDKTLADALKVGVVPGGVTKTNREDVLGEVTEWLPLATFVEVGELAAKNSDTYGIVIWWEPSDSDNDFNMNNENKGKTLSIDLGIKLIATQLDAEEDSFGPDYDEDAWLDGWKVYNAQDLQAAINNGETDIVLMDDIVADEAIVIPAAATTTYSLRSSINYVTINLNGKTLTIETAYDDANYLASSAVVNNGNVILTGEGTIKATNNYTIRNYGNMIIDGVTVENGIMNFADLTVESGNISNSRSGKHTIYGNNATLTINGGTFYNGNPGNAAIFAYAGKVTINAGEFSIADGTATLGWTSCLIDAQGNAVYTINGGVINGEIRDYNKNTTVYGGTFSHSSVSNFVAEGYVVVGNTDGTYTVQLSQESFDAMIESAADGDTVNVPAGTFTLSGDNNIVIVGSGADTVIDITGTINNINISNATVTGLNYLNAQTGDSITFTNVVFDGQFGHVDQGVIYGDAKFVGCTFNGGLHIDKSGADSEIVFEDCTFTELCYIKLSASAHYKFDGCVIEALNTKKVTSPLGRQWVVSYGDVTMTNCQIGRTIRAGGAIDVSLNNCVDADGAALTSTAVATNNSPFVIIDGVYYVKSTAILQAVLDRATTGTTIQLVENVAYGAVEIRPTATNETTMVCSSCSEGFTTTDAAAFIEHLADGKWHTTPDYTTKVKDITIIGAEGATVAGLTAISGHIYGDVYDYVRGKDYDAGSAYYCTLNISNLAFKNVAFTGQVNLNTSDADSVYDGVTFEGCSFTTGGTTSDYDAAIRYYNEANNGNVKNITVTGCTFNNCYQGVYVHHVNGITVSGCTFDTIGHNAIALQNHDGAVNLKNVVITGNTFNNVTDRVIRFNQVGADSNITIQNNTATNSGNTSGQIMKAESIASGVITNISGNTWSGTVVNTELQDK